MAESSQPTGETDLGSGEASVGALPDPASEDRGVDLVRKDPRGEASEEPDGGNLLVRIWEGPGWETNRGYSTTLDSQLAEF
jgi:hypothetical protein